MLLFLVMSIFSEYDRDLTYVYTCTCTDITGVILPNDVMLGMQYIAHLICTIYVYYTGNQML